MPDVSDTCSERVRHIWSIRAGVEIYLNIIIIAVEFKSMPAYDVNEWIDVNDKQ